MRILVANHAQAPRGGAETYLGRLLASGVNVGFDFRLLVEEQYAARSADARVATWVWSPGTEHEVLSGIESWAPEMVFVHGLYDSRLEAWLVSRWPSVLYAHNYYGTCLSGEKRFSFPHVQMCSRVLGLGCFAYCYSRRCGPLNPRTLLNSYASQSERRRLLDTYKRIVVASAAMRKEYLRHSVAPHRVVIIPPFVNEVTGSTVEADPSQPFAFLGRLTKLKGLRLLIRALSEELSLRRPGQEDVIVIGDGPERASATRLAIKLGVRARFTGWVDSDQTAGLLAESSVVAMPSLWPEPFGLAGVEAAAHGRPVVAFPVGGIPEWLERGVVGEMPEIGDFSVRGFSAALHRAVSEPQHYRTLSSNARALARRFGQTEHLRKLQSLFAEVIREG